MYKLRHDRFILCMKVIVTILYLETYDIDLSFKKYQEQQKITYLDQRNYQ